ncbi:MAG: acetyl-CoA acetyltransferase [Pseudomonadales bacterium]
MSEHVYILGGSQTDFSRNWAREGLGLFDMFSDCLTDAVTDSGVQPDQIEVGHVGTFNAQLFTGQGIMGGFFGHVFPEFSMLPSSCHEAACASGSMALLAAMRDIMCGHYETAAVIGIELMRNTDGKTAAEYLGAATWKGVEAQNVDYPWPHMFDRLVDEYDRRYGINCDHIKTIAEKNFSNAKTNSNAQTRGWNFPEGCFTDNDELNPSIEGRIRKLDCGQVTDGASAVVLASERFASEYAAQRGLSLSDIPRIKGWGHRSAPLLLDRKLELSANSDLIFPHAALCLSEAANRAGFSQASDLDGLETHDCFSITEYMAIDHSGLTAPGQSWQAVEEGRIQKDGDFPINASGGLIGTGHPVGATGVRMLLDCAKQVTGKADGYQLNQPQNMLTFNVGGSTTTCASFVVGVQ